VQEKAQRRGEHRAVAAAPPPPQESASMIVPADQHLRELLVSSFQHNYLVEASAGSGKTTILVERLVQLIAGGHARVHEIAALTFTRKAAAQLRSRFTERLEALSQDAAHTHHRQIEQVLTQQSLPYIGTIHGFCARLLREHHAAAGLPPGF